MFIFFSLNVNAGFSTDSSVCPDNTPPLPWVGYFQINVQMAETRETTAFHLSHLGHGTLSTTMRAGGVHKKESESGERYC